MATNPLFVLGQRATVVFGDGTSALMVTLTYMQEMRLLGFLLPILCFKLETLFGSFFVLPISSFHWLY
jgi:hypothetical protein